MTHPFDLHPLRDITSVAWNEVKQSQQPDYENLPMAVKSELLDRATRVESGDPMVEFERAVAEKLLSKKTESETATAEPAVEEDDEPVEATTEAEKEHLDLKGPLPDDFPSKAKLHDAGINTYGQLNKVEDLTTIDGIGPGFAKAIHKRLKADSKTLNKG